MALKSCWTCRDRKVKCDLGLPTCDNCRHRNLQCQGYGLRLSWPRNGDKRRSVEVKSTTKQRKHTLAVLYRHRHFLNVTNRDINMFYKLSEASNLTYTKMSIPPAPPSIPSLRVHEDESGLLQYFMNKGSRLLILDNLGHLTNSILQLAFYDATPASNAILNSLFTLSSLSLGRPDIAIVYKIRALSYLQESLRLGNVGHRTVQHLMASMLLYLCETYQLSTTTKDWSEYLCGAKQIVISGDLAREAKSDLSLFFDWVSYHETFARFGLVYWNQAEKVREITDFCAMIPVSAHASKPRHDFGCDRTVLSYTSWVFTRVIPLLTNSGNPSHLQMQDLYALEAKLRAGLLDNRPDSLPSDELSKDRDKITDLYRIGALIYLNRGALGYSGHELRHKNLVNKGLDILCGKLTYTPPWPVFMIACEATEDSQRMTALEILARAGEEPRSYNMGLIRLLVEACWNQDDLHDEEALDYHSKLRVVIQTAPYVPPFS